jgi:hypothetical protein
MSNDVLITPASRKIEFKDSSANVDAKIETDASGNLLITNTGGDISIGDTTSDIFVGDGTNSIDIVFEQDGEMRGTSGVTVTLGAADSNIRMATDLNLNSNDITNAGSITGTSFSDGTISGITFIDEDSFASNSATRIPTQQSIKAYVDAEVAGVVDSAPAALDTLNELAAALGDDANFSTTTSTALGNRLRVDTASQGLNGTQQANAITNLGITATKAELNYVDGVTSSIQTQLNGKQASGSYLTGNQTITLSGDVSGSGTTSIAVTIADDSHNHIISNVDGLQTALDAKLTSSSGLNASNLTSGTVPDARIAASSITQHTDSKYLRSDADDTTSGNITITKTNPTIILNDNNTTTSSYPAIQFDTSNAQGVRLEHNEFDNELPVAGYGLVLKESSNNSQFPSSGTLSFSVLGEIYAGATSLGSLNRVFHDGYHPNADVLTTARTINGVSFNGSANITVADSTKLPLAGGTVTGNTTFNTLVGVNKAINSSVGLSIGADATATNSYGLEVCNSTSNSRFLVDGVGSSFFYKSDNAVGMKFDASTGNVGIGQSSFGVNGKLQVTGGIGLTGNSEIRQSTNGDGSTLRFLGTQLVISNTNSNSYSYSGGGLIGSVSPAASAIMLDVGAVSTSGHRLKVINGGDGIAGSLQYLSGTTSRFYVDSSSGNVGIGTTPSSEFHVKGDADTIARIEPNNNEGKGTLLVSSASSGDGGMQYDANANRMYLFSYGDMSFNVGTGNLSGAYPANERMRIDSSGNTIVENLYVTNDSSATLSSATKTIITQDNIEMYYQSSQRIIMGRDQYSSGHAGIVFQDPGYSTSSGGVVVGSVGRGTMGFATSNNSSMVERMRLDSGGSLRLGTNTTTGYYGEKLTVTNSASYTQTSVRTGTGSEGHIAFNNANGVCGTIFTNGSATSYNVSSDYRLKENVVTDWDATTRLKQLKPSRFNFIVDADKTVDGFLAHEVQDIVPEAISGTKDAMRDEEYEVTPAVLDDDGNVVTEAVMGTRSVPEYQGIDQSKLVPLLVKTIQELEARITTLENA